EARHLLSLTFPHGIVCPAGGGRTVWRCEGCRQAGILEAAGDRGQVAVRGQMCGEDVEGTQGMGDARVEHMTEEERSEGTVEQSNLVGKQGIGGKDISRVDAAPERGTPTPGRRLKDYLMGNPTRRGKSGQALLNARYVIVERPPHDECSRRSLLGDER